MYEYITKMFEKQFAIFILNFNKSYKSVLINILLIIFISYYYAYLFKFHVIINPYYIFKL